MIEIVASGVPYTNFVSVSATLSVASLANDFSFTASAGTGFPDLKQGDKIVVLVDGVKKLTGNISGISGSETEGSHTVTYSGRDKTGDFLDSQIDTLDDINGDITLKALIELVISHLGQSIKVIDNVKSDPFNAAEDVIKPEVGENAFEFVQFYARKRQTLLTSDGDGNIVITQSSPVSSGETLQRLPNSDSNNILSQNWDLNEDAKFNRYIIRGQVDPLGLNNAGDTDIAAAVDQSGVVIDDSVRVGRQRVIVETDSYSSAELDDRAKWSKQIAAARATVFSCSTKDHSKPSGGVWDENTLVQINSNVADISRPMLIDTVTFSEGEGQPTITSFEFVERNVYTIDDKLLNQKKVGNQNDGFLG